MIEEHTAYYRSPIGILEIIGNADRVSCVSFVADAESTRAIPSCLQDCVEQLDDYFNGRRQEFSLKMDLRGTEFQKRVWRELVKIPYGKTVSYRDIASALGSAQSVRAVGAANGQNPIAIIVPCHRVIGSNGSLTGYGGGLWRKEWLLKLEGSLRQTGLFDAAR